jgi:serine protease inhibitor ecotin
MAEIHPEPTPDAGTKRQILRFHERRKNSKLSVVCIIVTMMMLSAVPASSRRVGSLEG